MKVKRLDEAITKYINGDITDAEYEAAKIIEIWKEMHSKL